MSNDHLTADCDQLMKSLSLLVQTFVEYEDVAEQDNAQVRNIREIEQDLKSYFNDLIEENRLLRLGIVGQIKSGKSSLLNLLLFDGLEVLPKAATPMTASLTHIVKSDRDEIEVEYYSHKDWQEIKRHANEYRRQKASSEPAEFMRASNELVEMVEKRRLRIDPHLGKTEVMPASIGELNGRLRQLVGSEGKMTPLVKSVTIRCSQGLPDIDIVDTPGINDPIASRSRETNNLLKQCDAVLLLSSAPQFMDSTDSDFFHNQVPAEGISRRLLIGSKFDSALIDVSKDYAGDLQKAMDFTEENLVNQAKDVIGPNQDRSEDGSMAIEEDDIIFVSAMCAILATKPVTQWSEEEQAILDNLHKRYPDWIDRLAEGEKAIDENTLSILADLGNREAVDECLAAIRKDKNQIIQDKMEDFLQEKRDRAIEELKDLIANLEERRELLLETDLAEIEQQQEAVTELMEDIREKIVDEWERLIDEQTAAFKNLRDTINEEAKDARTIISSGVNVRVKSKRIEKKGAFPWIARKLWEGGYKSEDYEEQILNAADIEEGIRNMEEELNEEIQEVSETIFSFGFTRKAKSTMDTLLANEFSSELAHAIKSTRIQRSIRYAIDEVAKQGRKELEELNEKIDSTFHGYELNNEESPIKGQENARKMVRSLSRQSTDWIDKAKEQVDKITVKAKEALVPAAVQELKDYLGSIEKDLESREFKLQRYELAMDKLKRHQSEIHQDHS